MKSTFTKTLVLAAFFTLSACGQNFGPAQFEEDISEAEAVKIDGTGEAPTDLDDLKAAQFSPSETAQILAKHSHLDPKRLVPSRLLEQAVIYFEANKTKFANQNYISVIDFSKKSTKARFFIINLKSGAVWALHTAHGSGSDTNHDGIAESFGNVSGSNKSSLGFYRTAETYQGRNGYSLRLDGLSSTNSRARSRAIVIHGANYVRDANTIQGRSAGCPAVSHTNRDKMINQIKNGSLIYAHLSGAR